MSGTIRITLFLESAPYNGNQSIATKLEPWNTWQDLFVLVAEVTVWEIKQIAIVDAEERKVQDVRETLVDGQELYCWNAGRDVTEITQTSTTAAPLAPLAPAIPSASAAALPGPTDVSQPPSLSALLQGPGISNGGFTPIIPSPTQRVPQNVGISGNSRTNAPSFRGLRGPGSGSFGSHDHAAGYQGNAFLRAPRPPLTPCIEEHARQFPGGQVPAPLPRHMYSADGRGLPNFAGTTAQFQQQKQPFYQQYQQYQQQQQQGQFAQPTLGPVPDFTQQPAFARPSPFTSLLPSSHPARQQLQNYEALLADLDAMATRLSVGSTGQPPEIPSISQVAPQRLVTSLATAPIPPAPAPASIAGSTSVLRSPLLSALNSNRQHSGGKSATESSSQRYQQLHRPSMPPMQRRSLVSRMIDAHPTATRSYVGRQGRIAGLTWMTEEQARVLAAPAMPYRETLYNQERDQVEGIGEHIHRTYFTKAPAEVQVVLAATDSAANPLTYGGRLQWPLQSSSGNWEDLRQPQQHEDLDDKDVIT